MCELEETEGGVEQVVQIRGKYSIFSYFISDTKHFWF